jgi:UDP-N-acetylmuramoyl-L-alanyl-D-glutamate--2,6-diaminopimelate ligase
MQLSELTENLSDLGVTGSTMVEIGSIVYDSRKVTPGSIFVALKGLRHDGMDFVREAVGKGAAAVMVSEEKRSEAAELLTGSAASLITSRELRKDMAVLAARLCGQPARSLGLVGITGTNGKTTTAYITESILKAAGKKTGVIGTVSYRSDRSVVTAGQTTPEAVDLQQMLKEMVEGGTEFCLLEVSSHALDLERVWACRFHTALFTNLSQDHLDFHGDMETYFNAKRRLFRQFEVGTSIINIDDPWGRRLMTDCPGRKLTYGRSCDAVIRAEGLSISIEGLEFTLTCPGGSFLLQSPLTGEHNVYNVLAASAIALAADVDVAHIQEGVAALNCVPGRFQRVDEGQDFTVIVDYAHSEDALRKLLEAARNLCRGRVIALFGCGGDRDKGKRPLMGKVAAELSDLTVITSDNPRSEHPMCIIKQIEEGFLSAAHGGVEHMVLPDRREAIQKAIASAGRGDMVVIAGKGHEKYQIVGDRRLPFDDVEEAREAISENVSLKA